MVVPKFVLDNLMLKGQNSTFDEIPSKYDISDVSFTLLNASLKRETGKEIDNLDYNLNEEDYFVINLFVLIIYRIL